MKFRSWVRIALIVVYLVIIAGALVRMTGSGMGCPDWPKCFGYYIPPTDVETLQWSADRIFEKGQVIIKDDALLVAVSDFTTMADFNSKNWETYTRHDYAKFNVWHTWIEYINRLLGALSGLAILIMAVLSFGKWRKDKWLTILSVLSVFMIGFQAWLGATVVYSVLAPVRITMHMLMALLIVAVLIYLLERSSEAVNKRANSKLFRNLLIFGIILTLVQITMGTQLRQFVDEQVSNFGYDAKERWLENPTINFYLHRSFSIVVLLVSILIWHLNRKFQYGFGLVNWILVLVLLEAITGIAMYYFDFPFGSQPIHLVVAALLFGIHFYLTLAAFRAKETVELS